MNMAQGRGWRELTIDQLGRVVTGKTPPTSRAELFGTAHPFITPTDIDLESGARRARPARGLSGEGAEFMRRLALPKNTPAFVCIGATIGKICLTDLMSFTNQQINSVIVDQRSHDPVFVYYLLAHNAGRIRALAGGAATPIVNKSAFSQVLVRVPELPTQRRIAEILGAYDDLIENNTRRIAILEEMARRLYEDWFVRFRFPGHEQARMVDSPLGPIPEEWQVRVLGAVADLAYGRALTADDRRPGPVAVYGSSGVVGAHSENLVAGPGIVVGRKGTVGSVHWSDGDFWPIDTTYYVVSEQPPRFLYFVLRSLTFVNTDAAVPGLNRNYALSKEIVLPPHGLALRFDNHCDSAFRMRRVLERQIENLRTQRDLLLPKLISGEVDVSEAPSAEEVAAA